MICSQCTHQPSSKFPLRVIIKHGRGFHDSPSDHNRTDRLLEQTLRLLQPTSLGLDNSCKKKKAQQKHSETSTGLKPITSAIPVRCSTDWAMKPRRKQDRCELNFWALDDITQKDLVREGPGKSFMIHVMCYKMHGNHGDFKDAQWVGLLHGGKAGFRELYSSIPEGFPIFFWVSFLFFALGLGLGLWLGLRFEPVGSRSGASSIYPRYMKRVKWCVYDINHIYELRIKNMKVIFAVGKQLKQLQTKPRKYSEASTEFEPMTSAIPV